MTKQFEILKNKIYLIRNKKVMLDSDVAQLYEVETKALNRAVKLNINRFPENCMFQLNDKELNELVTNYDRLEILKHTASKPYVFTGQGVAMLSSVLNSERAINVNIQIIRMVVQYKKMLATPEDTKGNFEDIGSNYDEQLLIMFQALNN